MGARSGPGSLNRGLEGRWCDLRFEIDGSRADQRQKPTRGEYLREPLVVDLMEKLAGLLAPVPAAGLRRRQPEDELDLRLSERRASKQWLREGQVLEQSVNREVRICRGTRRIPGSQVTERPVVAHHRRLVRGIVILHERQCTQIAQGLSTCRCAGARLPEIASLHRLSPVLLAPGAATPEAYTG